MAREDHCCMDDVDQKPTCLHNVCVCVLEQEGWRERNGPSMKGWREWWDWWKRL